MSDIYTNHLYQSLHIIIAPKSNIPLHVFQRVTEVWRILYYVHENWQEMELHYLLFGSYGILPDMLGAKKTRNVSVKRFFESLERKFMIMAVMCAWLDGSTNTNTTLSQHTRYKRRLDHDFLTYVPLLNELTTVSQVISCVMFFRL